MAHPAAMRRPHALLVAFLVTPPAWLVTVIAPPPLAAQTAGNAEKAEGAQEDLARGDAAWLRRAEGHQGGRALPAPVGEAIAAYEAALKADPGSLDAYWKLLRGYHFRGEYVAQTREAKQAAFGRGREVAEAGIDRLAARLPRLPRLPVTAPGTGARARLDRMTPQEAARALSAVEQAKAILLWGAVDWGLWGDAFGRLAAARQGVGDRVRRYGEVVLAIDDRYESAGAHRLLGRLHALAPKVPFITGWVDRDKAISELERAVALGPADPTNDLYLAEAILDHRPARKPEAIAILRRLAARQPSPERVVEESKVLEEARALLGRQGASG
jgi:tetratricopeptide (TPR) repeat protein